MRQQTKKRSTPWIFNENHSLKPEWLDEIPMKKSSVSPSSVFGRHCFHFEWFIYNGRRLLLYSALSQLLNCFRWVFCDYNFLWLYFSRIFFFKKSSWYFVLLSWCLVLWMIWFYKFSSQLSFKDVINICELRQSTR